jgi:CHASE3 domain sensor protein
MSRFEEYPLYKNRFEEIEPNEKECVQDQIVQEYNQVISSLKNLNDSLRTFSLLDNDETSHSYRTTLRDLGVVLESLKDVNAELRGCLVFLKI